MATAPINAEFPPPIDPSPRRTISDINSVNVAERAKVVRRAVRGRVVAVRETTVTIEDAAGGTRYHGARQHYAPMDVPVGSSVEFDLLKSGAVTVAANVVVVGGAP